MADNKPSESKVQETRPRQQGKKVAQTIVRISGKDIDGSFHIEKALIEIKGIGRSMAHALAHSIKERLNIDPESEIGSISEEQVRSISALISDPAKYGVPKYMLNNRGYIENGSDVHLVGSELTMASRQYVSRDITARTWRGYRHQGHLKVRGQRERSTGRTGETVRVSKKKEEMKKPAPGGGNKK